MNIISLKELQAKLTESKGAKIITLTTITNLDLKKDCPHKNVRKIQRINGVINFNYSSTVNRQREREGKPVDFQAKKRKWGTKLDGLPFISHVKKDGENCLYLEMKVERILEENYRDDEGNTLSKDQLTDYFKAKSSNKEVQGTEKEIIIRDFDVKDIITIDIDGSSYLVRL